MACNPLPFMLPAGSLSRNEMRALLMLTAPIVWIEPQGTYHDNHGYENDGRYHLPSSNFPLIYATSCATVFNLS